MPGDDSVSTVDLLRRSVADGSRLVQQEVQLAKQEIGESLRAGVTAVIAGVIGVVAALAFLVMAIVTIIVAVNPHWVAALVFTALFLVVAAVMAMVVRGRIRSISPLTKTRESVQEDITWAKQQLKPGQR